MSNSSITPPPHRQQLTHFVIEPFRDQYLHNVPPCGVDSAYDPGVPRAQRFATKVHMAVVCRLDQMRHHCAELARSEDGERAVRELETGQIVYVANAN